MLCFMPHNLDIFLFPENCSDYLRFGFRFCFCSLFHFSWRSTVEAHYSVQVLIRQTDQIRNESHIKCSKSYGFCEALLKFVCVIFASACVWCGCVQVGEYKCVCDKFICQSSQLSIATVKYSLLNKQALMDQFFISNNLYDFL